MSVVVPGFSSGQQRPEVSGPSQGHLDLKREALEGPVVLPGEPRPAGVIPVHVHTHHGGFTQRSFSPGKPGVHMHKKVKRGDTLSEDVLKSRYF